MNEINKTSSQPQNIASSTTTTRPAATPPKAVAKPTTPPPAPAPLSPVSPPKAVAPPEPKPQPVQSKPAQGTVRFEFEAPKAKSVSVAGTFNGWKPGATPLNGVGAGKWAKEVALAPGRYEYRFVVDGQWADDPRAKSFTPNPHGGRNAVLEISPARN